jgi:hypothetical protein
MMKKYIYIVALTVFMLSFTINVSALSQFASELVEGSTVPMPERHHHAFAGNRLNRIGRQPQ